MTEQNPTNAAETAGAPPASTEEVAAAVDVEAKDGAEYLTQVAEKAAAVRNDNEYDGVLTAKMVAELTSIMHAPTPARYVKHIPPATGKPYASTGLNSVQFQQDMLNAGYGRSHWRELRHYPRDVETAAYGFICKVVIVVGNDLSKAKLDEHGQLVLDDAEVLAMGEEWGSVKNATAPADAFKGSATNAFKRAAAAFGPGGDVYRAEFDDENVGGTGNLSHAPAGNGNGQSGGQRQGGKPASEAQQRMLRAKARDAGLDDAQFANTILWANQSEPVTFENAAQAKDYLDRLLAALPWPLVDPVKNALEQIKAQAASQGAQAHAAQAAANGVQHTGRSDIPNDVAPLQPQPAAPNGNGATPQAA